MILIANEPLTRVRYWGSAGECCRRGGLGCEPSGGSAAKTIGVPVAAAVDAAALAPAAVVVMAGGRGLVATAVGTAVRAGALVAAAVAAGGRGLVAAGAIRRAAAAEPAVAGGRATAVA